MKKINIILFAILASIITSCTSEVDDVFSDSSANRIAAALQEDKDILTSASNGWLMKYYPDAAASPQYGGYNVLVKFTTDGHVTVATDAISGQATSTYTLIQSAGPLLSFDTYNDVMHFFSDPTNPAGIGSNGTGMGGDFEFRIISATKDKVVMTGKKHNSRIVMTPMAAGQNWSEYISTLSKAETSMSFKSYKYVYGKDTADVSCSYRCLVINYKDSTGSAVSKNVPFIVTPTGYELYDTLKIGGLNVTEFTYKGDSKYTFTTDAGADANLYGQVSIGLALMSGSDWFFSYSNMGSTTKKYWAAGVSSLNNEAGEDLKYFFLEGNILYFNSGGYRGAFSYKYTLIGNDKVTLALSGYAGTDSQKGNAQWYYSSVSGFKYFLAPLNGTFTLTTDDARNPTWIKLTDIKDANNSMIVTQAASAPY